MSIVVEPPLTEWPVILRENVEAAKALAAKTISTTVELSYSSIRNAILHIARQHSEHVEAVAQERGIALPPVAPLGPSGAIIMAGHQPLIYHPGLLFKEEMLHTIARQEEATPINVVVDTDEGDAGEIRWPTGPPEAPRIMSATIGSGTGVYRGHLVAPPAEVESVFRSITASLSATGLKAEAARAASAEQLYTALTGVPLVIANSIVRSVWTGLRSLEVPLSRVVECPEIAAIIQTWIADYKKFVPLYNQVLEEHRAARKIKNPANPFPNMKIEGDRYELPFWEIERTGARRPLLIGASGAKSPEPGWSRAPRGSLVTLLLRGYCSDLFIHGLGGAKYDLFVDEFAVRYLGTALPRFVVASKTSYLFPERVEEYEKAVDLKARYKEIVSHTAKFIECGIFTEQEAKDLRELIAPREDLLKSMHAASSPAERSAVAHRLNALNRSLRERIDSSSLRDRLALLDKDSSILAAWRSREYPFFLFHDPVIS